MLFEITDLSTKGLAQFIYREFCKELMDTYRWINAMDDSGLENLKRVKNAYHPTRLIPSYNIEPQGKLKKVKMKSTLIFLNGYYDTRHLDFYHQEIVNSVGKSFSLLICADGGIRIFDTLNQCRERRFIPDILIGDMDSVADRGYKSLIQAKHVVQEWIGKTDKDYTDGQLAVDYALEEYGCRHIIMYGGLPRPEVYETDQFLGNLKLMRFGHYRVSTNEPYKAEMRDPMQTIHYVLIKCSINPKEHPIATRLTYCRNRERGRGKERKPAVGSGIIAHPSRLSQTRSATSSLKMQNGQTIQLVEGACPGLRDSQLVGQNFLEGFCVQSSRRSSPSPRFSPPIVSVSLCAAASGAAPAPSAKLCVHRNAKRMPSCKFCPR